MLLDPLLWTKLAVTGYILTISLETPVLFLGLRSRYSVKERLFAGAFLTACSYPFVAVFFPMIWNPYQNYNTYILVSEVFAPVSECAVFAWLFQRQKKLQKRDRIFDYVVITVANLVSYVTGEVLKSMGFSLA